MANNHTRYGRCECCGGRITEKRLTVDRRFDGKLYEFEEVPVGVCTECGQRVYKGPVLEQMQRLAKSKARFKRSIRVPVARYEPARLD